VGDCKRSQTSKRREEKEKRCERRGNSGCVEDEGLSNGSPKKTLEKGLLGGNSHRRKDIRRGGEITLLQRGDEKILKDPGKKVKTSPDQTRGEGDCRFGENGRIIQEDWREPTQKLSEKKRQENLLQGIILCKIRYSQ